MDQPKVYVNIEWLPLRYGEPILDYIFESEDAGPVLGDYPVSQLDDSEVSKIFRELATKITREAMYVNNANIALVDEDVSFDDASAVYFPLGKGEVEIFHSDRSDDIYPFSYRDLIFTKNVEGVTFYAPEAPYYVLSFSASIRLENLPPEMLVTIRERVPYRDRANFAASSKAISTIPQEQTEQFLRECNIYNRTRREWLRAGGSPRVDCYYYFIDKIKSQNRSVVNSDDDDEYDEEVDEVSKEMSYFVYKSLENAARKGYFDVIKAFYDFDFDYPALNYIRIYEHTFEDLPVNIISLFNQLTYRASQGRHYDILKYLLERTPEGAFREMENIYKYQILDSTPEIIDYVLEKGYVRRTEAFSWKVSNDAIKSGNMPVLEYMLSEGVDPSPNRYSFRDAINSGNVDMVKYVYHELTKNGKKVYADWDDIQAAVRNSTPEVIDFVITIYQDWALGDLNLPFLYANTADYGRSKYLLSIMPKEDLIRGLSYLTHEFRIGQEDVTLKRFQTYIESPPWQSLSKEDKLKSLDNVIKSYDYYKVKVAIGPYLESVRWDIETSR